jgi:hypothetical protein
MLKLYRALLRLYPADFRAEFGDEMTSVFVDSQRERSTTGPLPRGMFYLRELAGLILGALRERSRSLVAFPRWIPIPSQLPLRSFTMTSQFRFPKTTAVLMTIILAGVILAIKKGEAIATLPYANPPVPPNQPDYLMLLPSLAAMFLAASMVAGFGWVVLFLLRRTGVHRLSEMSSASATK